MAVHGIMSAQFGDWEWDIGKSVYWTQQFVDTAYAIDINVGSGSRSYLLDWDKSFPAVKAKYFSNRSFFESTEAAALWRKDSFEAADAQYSYDANDWVIFVDTTEGLCVDDGGMDFPSFDPLNPPVSTPGSVANPACQAYLLDEIANADDDGLFLPVWAFTRNSQAFTVAQTIDNALQVQIDALAEGEKLLGLTKDELTRINTSFIDSAYSSYVLAGWSPRLFKVSVLRDPGFDWTMLDTFYDSEDIDSGLKAQLHLSLITYAYARWTEDPSNIDPTTGLPLDVSEEQDLGFRMRKLISEIRPIDGLDLTWPVTDEATEYYGFLRDYLVPQMGVSRTSAEGPQFDGGPFSSDFLDFTRRNVGSTDPWPAGYLDLSTPLYYRIFRQNIREGLFYRDNVLGPVPWSFISGRPAVPADKWNLHYLESNR